MVTPVVHRADTRRVDAFRTNEAVQLAKGKYISTSTKKVIEILDMDVRMVLENGKPRNGLVLYRYSGSTVLRVAPRMWFLTLDSNGNKRFIKMEGDSNYDASADSS